MSVLVEIFRVLSIALRHPTVTAVAHAAIRGATAAVVRHIRHTTRKSASGKNIH